MNQIQGKAPPVIVIRRKRADHGQPHGGAWKVAYADFVTAMMALFIVLWLLSSSDKVRQAVGGYFTNPKGHGHEVGNGLRGAGSESLSVRKDDMPKLRDQLAQALKSTPELEKLREQVVFTITNEGLRIELIDKTGSSFFESGSSQPTATGKELLGTLAEEIGKIPNTIAIEGHTDSKMYGGDGDYSNWELSADRANAARRYMEKNGIQPDQVVQVRGFAARTPRDSASPADAVNRRVTVIVQYQPIKADGQAADEDNSAPDDSRGPPK